MHSRQQYIGFRFFRDFYFVRRNWAQLKVKNEGLYLTLPFQRSNTALRSFEHMRIMIFQESNLYIS
jgi:hypothetical protein